MSDEGKDTTRKYLRGEISKAAYYNAIRKATEDYQRALGLRPKHERRRKRWVDAKNRLRDRFHGKFGMWGKYVGRWVFGRRFEPDYTFNRVKSHTETGYGVAYEPRSEIDKKG